MNNIQDWLLLPADRRPVPPEYPNTELHTELDKAEKLLNRIGYFIMGERVHERFIRWKNYTGEKMFTITDKNGNQIHTDDEVLWQDKKCIVTCIFNQNEIQVNPLGEGLPCCVTPNEVTVTNSFIEQLRKLSTCEELQKILACAEARFAQEQKTLKEISSRDKKLKPAKETEKEEGIAL